MNNIYVDAIGISSAGLKNWESSAKIFTGEAEHILEPVELLKPQTLPSNERRRSTKLIRLAFNACEQLIDTLGIDELQVVSVFASSGGDYEILDKICQTLCTESKSISPTQFHNTVHNAPAGYWSQAIANTQTYTSLSAADYTFATGFLEAISYLLVHDEPVLLNVYDMLTEPPIYKQYPIDYSFSASIKLSPQPSKYSIAKLSCQLLERSSLTNNESHCATNSLETLRINNPAARCLPLLESIATNGKTVSINQSDDLQLDITVNQL